jgi:hypothetical protein
MTAPRFLQNFLAELRIWLCAKHVLANLPSLTPAQGSRLALIIALLRTRALDVPVPGGNATLGEIVQRPTAYRSELCYTAFSLLRDIRQDSREKVRSYASFGILPNPKVKEHNEICDLALSFLMSTIGVGCKPNTLDSVKYAWHQLATYSPDPSDVASIVNMPEHLVQDLIGDPIEPHEWLQLARQNPDFLAHAT